MFCTTPKLKEVLNKQGNDVLYNSKAQRSSEETNTLSFCPRCCCSNLKQPKSGIKRMYVCASHVGDEDDGGATGPDGVGGAGGVCRRDI